MVVVTTRVKAEIKASKTLAENVITAIDELDKLIKYYETEIKENNNEIKDVQKTADEGWETDVAFILGKNNSYLDSIVEMGIIVDTLRGKL